MKRLIFLLVGFVFFSTSGWANHSNQWNYNPRQSFIFTENGIEFSVFQDGQFDFYLPNYGPNINVGFSTSNVSFSFNTGYNYSPFVQYDSYGAVIQIENTPIFYDHYGRVNQIGNVWIDYNYRGLVTQIGGLQVFYRNGRFWRQRGFINRFNRRYTWRPWHRFYAIPPNQFCLLSVRPYRQFYQPRRHVYYRPYRENVRHFDLNRQNPVARQRTNRTHQRYAQSPRNRAERQLRSNVQRQNLEITRTRNTRVARTNRAQIGRDVNMSRNSNRLSEVNTRNRRANTSPQLRTEPVSRESRTSRRNNSAVRTEQNTRNNRSVTQSSRRSEQTRSNHRKSSDVSRTMSKRNDNIRRQSSSRQPSVNRSRSTSNRKAVRAQRNTSNNRSNTTRSSRSRS